MKKSLAYPGLLFSLISAFGCVCALGQTGPCSNQSGKLACVIPLMYGSPFNAENVLYDVGGHPMHFNSGAGSIGNLLAPLTSDIGREANLLPLASPSSGIVLTYDPSVKTFVVSTDSLGPILGERGDTVGRHHVFVGFSYQYFDFDKIDGINLRSIPAVSTHTDDGRDNSSSTVSVNCSINTTQNLNGCAFIRDSIHSMNSIALNINQYTGYITFGLTKHLDVSMVIPFETVRMSLYSQNTIVLGSSGFFNPTPGSPDSPTGTPPNKNQNNPPNGPPLNGQPYFFHLFKDCPNTSPAGGATALDPRCQNHTFPDPTWIGTTFAANGTATVGPPLGSSAHNSASGIGDVVARVKWNALSGERLKFATGFDVRFPTGDAVNYLGSGSYGVKPFVVLSYRARVSPHVLVGYEWNSNSILSSRLFLLPPGKFGPPQSSIGLVQGSKGYMPSDFVYSAGADVLITKWLTGAFDIVGARFFRGGTESDRSQPFLAPCAGDCSAAPNPNTTSYASLATSRDASYSVDNASMGVKIRPFPKASKLVITANVLVRLDDGGLRSKPAPLVGLGYTF